MDDRQEDSGDQPPMAVIFDVDGTLYHQRSLRLRMLRDLLFASLLSARARQDLRILRQFRRDREELSEKVSSGFAEAQYRVTAEGMGLSPQRIQAAVEEWIYHRPLPYLKRFRIEGIWEWLAQLRGQGVKLGVYSEYPAMEKLAALDLEFDAVVSSVDGEVDAFKPNPKGILVALERLGVAPERALYVGDRLDRDLPCAEAAGVAFLHVGKGLEFGTAAFPPPEHLLPDFLKGDRKV